MTGPTQGAAVISLASLRRHFSDADGYSERPGGLNEAGRVQVLKHLRSTVLGTPCQFSRYMPAAVRLVPANRRVDVSR